MTSYVSAGLRQQVESRADGVCEYCLIHEKDTYLGCQVDHVVSEKHGGATDSDNLAYACTFCNRAKGSDVGSIAAAGEFTRFFNPRADRWGDHFTLRGVIIEPRTSIGEVTARILGFNEPEWIRSTEYEGTEYEGTATKFYTSGRSILRTLRTPYSVLLLWPWQFIRRRVQS